MRFLHEQQCFAPGAGWWKQLLEGERWYFTGKMACGPVQHPACPSADTGIRCLCRRSALPFPSVPTQSWMPLIHHLRCFAKSRRIRCCAWRGYPSLSPTQLRGISSAAVPSHTSRRSAWSSADIEGQIKASDTWEIISPKSPKMDWQMRADFLISELMKDFLTRQPVEATARWF